jgi:uncharacterized protein YciI
MIVQSWHYVVAVVLCVVCALVAVARQPEGMDCKDVVLVQYHGGPNWTDSQEHVEGHLGFLRREMKAGRLLFAGPFKDDAGGISIYEATDLGKVDVLVNQDPLVANKVVSYSLHRWKMCSLAAGE